MVRCTRTATSILAGAVSATSPSIPAVLRPALRCVARRTLTSVQLAPLAPALAEPGDQLLAGGCRDCRAVIDDRPLLPVQRYSAEPGDQRLPARPLGDGLEAVPLPVRSVRRGLVLAGHVRHPG